jgi:hypothetical protein
MKLAFFLADLAARLLPAHHVSWGDVMRQETASIEEPLEATRFAAGCLWAALAMRITLMKAFVFTGRMFVGAVTILYGLSFLYFMTNGLFHTKPFPLLPYLLGWQAIMGLSHIAAGAFLIGWHPRLFLLACSAATAAGLSLTLYGIIGMIIEQRPSGVLVFAVAWPLISIALLMTAAWVLDSLERRANKPKTA